jgi:AcrR family transcriptional regulator
LCLSAVVLLTAFVTTCQSDGMGETKADNKEEIYFAVCNAILKMEFTKGHLKWTVSDIARESKITRSLIYYYFGKEKKAVLEVAYQFIISHFYNIDRAKKVTVRERLRDLLEDIKNMPYMVNLFYMAKIGDSEFGRMIRDKEKALLKAMEKEFPHLSEIQILEVYLLELGALIYHLPPEKTDSLFELYLKK